jgi:hypothetical protein
MNFDIWIEENKDKIDWQSIETLPWKLNTEFDPPHKYMPLGILLRYTRLREVKKRYALIGDNISGSRTSGCSCCSVEWVDVIERRGSPYVKYDGWAWAFKA